MLIGSRQRISGECLNLFHNNSALKQVLVQSIWECALIIILPGNLTSIMCFKELEGNYLLLIS